MPPIPTEVTYTTVGIALLGLYEVMLRPVGRQVKDALYTNIPEQS